MSHLGRSAFPSRSRIPLTVKSSFSVWPTAIFIHFYPFSCLYHVSCVSPEFLSLPSLFQSPSPLCSLFCPRKIQRWKLDLVNRSSAFSFASTLKCQISFRQNIMKKEPSNGGSKGRQFLYSTRNKLQSPMPVLFYHSIFEYFSYFVRYLLCEKGEGCLSCNRFHPWFENFKWIRLP